MRLPKTRGLRRRGYDTEWLQRPVRGRPWFFAQSPAQRGTVTFASIPRVRTWSLRWWPQVQTWGYNEGVPGPEIRVTEDTLRTNVLNRRRRHHHPLARPPRAQRHGRCAAHHAATHKERGGVHLRVRRAYRRHLRLPLPRGAQLDRGLYGPLIVRQRREPRTTTASMFCS